MNIQQIRDALRSRYVSIDIMSETDCLVLAKHAGLDIKTGNLTHDIGNYSEDEQMRWAVESSKNAALLDEVVDDLLENSGLVYTDPNAHLYRKITKPNMWTASPFQVSKDRGNLSEEEQMTLAIKESKNAALLDELTNELYDDVIEKSKTSYRVESKAIIQPTPVALTSTTSTTSTTTTTSTTQIAKSAITKMFSVTPTPNNNARYRLNLGDEYCGISFSLAICSILRLWNVTPTDRQTELLNMIGDSNTYDRCDGVFAVDRIAKEFKMCIAIHNNSNGSLYQTNVSADNIINLDEINGRFLMRYGAVAVCDIEDHVKLMKSLGFNGAKLEEY